MIASFIPVGEEFHATVRWIGFEETLNDDDGRPLRFPSAASAVAYAQRHLKAAGPGTIERAALHKSIDETAATHDSLRTAWKRQKADEQRRLREQFDMRGVEVVYKRRKKNGRPG